MPGFIYLLCAFTSFLCMVLLFRGYRSTGMRLLLWSAVCFLGMTLDNVFLFVDRIVYPSVDFSLYRPLPGLFGLCALLYGLVWEAE